MKRAVVGILACGVAAGLASQAHAEPLSKAIKRISRSSVIVQRADVIHAAAAMPVAPPPKLQAGLAYQVQLDAATEATTREAVAQHVASAN